MKYNPQKEKGDYEKNDAIAASYVSPPQAAPSRSRHYDKNKWVLC